jgi:tetratricopeptide (TPR) repeat protein
VEERPDDVELRQRMVELAYQSGDEGVLVEAYLGLGGALQRGGQTGRANAAFQQVLQLDPDNAEAQAALSESDAIAKPVREVASHEDYVDLGSLILGEEGEKTTRFVVAYEEPSGDEAADFAKMLSQFKDKVSANLEADDVRAHHDLGTAYMEMGLLDEAVSEFQQALRASADHLPTYEVLGQTFLEMGKPEAAVRSLKRALEIEYDIEDELIGIYYALARALEEVGDKDQAVEFYDRVFSLDINFADVTERLRALR